MFRSELLEFTKTSDKLLAALEDREIVLWLQHPLPALPEDLLARFLKLPWKAVISESSDPQILNVAASESSGDPMVRKRGYIHIVDTDPSRLILPERCLPVYLLNGASSTMAASSPFEARLREMTMLEAIRRAAPKELIVLSTTPELSSPLRDLWDSGFRTHLTFVSSDQQLRTTLQDWVSGQTTTVVALIASSSIAFVTDYLDRYESIYPPESHVIRIRDDRGELTSGLSQ